ncbi:hypothetical protein [Nannocystis punicea]|uniref:Uncharacterized protein n=1 Tax=Nannocystis punicea TaxID=2995304 RepID=A0ABY7GW86_9BACT|nr:hypothetical protein [Nannocystis poenicansa]WAS91222.1 hypothetical protein O0S08_33965 [Nannocystis poenicansa]
MRLRLGEHGGRWLELDDWYEPGGDALRFDDCEHALQLLGGLHQPAALLALRTRLAERHPGAHRLDDVAVLRQIAEALHTGALAVRERAYPRYSARLEVEVLAAARVVLPAPPPRIAEPSSLEPLAAAGPEPAPLPAIEPAAQVRALREAARSRAPFCEICRLTGS